jgi:hypothetical protein
MAAIPLLQIANTKADLKAMKPEGNVLLLGNTTIGDGSGGFYYWDSTNTASSEDTTFLNFITSTFSGASGRWTRVFQRAQQLAQGILVNNGGVKSFYCPAVTDSNGNVTVNLTTENTSNGTALLSRILFVGGIADPASSSNVALVDSSVVSANFKTVTMSFKQSNLTTLGSTLLTIGGTLIPGLKAAGAGVNVIVKVEGM